MNAGVSAQQQPFCRNSDRPAERPAPLFPFSVKTRKNINFEQIHSPNTFWRLRKILKVHKVKQHLSDKVQIEWIFAQNNKNFFQVHLLLILQLFCPEVRYCYWSTKVNLDQDIKQKYCYLKKRDYRIFTTISRI